MNADIEPSIGTTTVVQQMLLINHLKAFKLPTFRQRI